MLTNKTLLKNYRLAKKINHNNDSVYWRDINNLKKFNFGNPEILKINFVLKLKIKKIKSGNEVIKCTIK